MSKNYIVSKNQSRLQWRIYTDKSENIEGKILFQGHKLSIEPPILEQIIDFKIERGSGMIFTPDYINENKYFEGGSNSLTKNLNKSWETLKKKIESEIGSFRKITVTQVYI